jgi:hypothetical protein
MAGCGYVGVRRSFRSEYTGHFGTTDLWFAADTGAIVGIAGKHGANPLLCEGQIPSSDCPMTTCDPCSKSGMTCSLNDVGL